MEELKNITIIVKADKVNKLILIFEPAKEFHVVLEAIKRYLTNIEFSEQNNKINSYTTALTEKLKEGITLTIVNTKEQEDVIYCPECGMQCDPIIPYCMECGASI